jgi:endonuclease YncB( thermonuclease family)
MYRRWVLAVGAVLLSAPVAAAEYSWPIVRVIDGDTMEVRLEGMPVAPLDRLTVRVVGVDAPAKGSRAQCPLEEALGELATTYVTAAVKAGRVSFEPLGWDKYGGRINAIVRIDGEDLAAALISRGLGQPYHGSQRPTWCEASAVLPPATTPAPLPMSEPELGKRGCCSHHGGVCSCSQGRAACCDGTLSPSCGC